MLLERANSLASLRERVSQAATSRGSTVLLSGEAGIGKSSRLEAFRSELIAGDWPQKVPARLAWGACDALFTPRPLGPLYDMAAELGEPVQSALERESSQPELLAALLDDLRNRSTTTVLVFEDVHWACLLYTSPSPRDLSTSRMPSSA